MRIGLAGLRAAGQLPGGGVVQGLLDWPRAEAQLRAGLAAGEIVVCAHAVQGVPG